MNVDGPARRTQKFLDEHAIGVEVIEVGHDTSTVDAAATSLGVAAGQIAKTLVVKSGDHVFLLVTAGDARLDNTAFKNRFGTKPRMLAAGEAEVLTGQPVGGIGPFGHESQIRTYCDESLRRFATVYPSGGSRTSAVRVTPEQLAELTEAVWVSVCRVQTGMPAA